MNDRYTEAYKEICEEFLINPTDLIRKKAKVCTENKNYDIGLVGLETTNVDVGNKSFNFNIDQIYHNLLAGFENADPYVPQYCLVAIDPDTKTQIAMIGIHISLEKIMGSLISQIYVRPEHRKKGIGRQMISVAEIFICFTSQSNIISLMSLPNSLSFFESCGYIKRETILDGSSLMTKMIPRGKSVKSRITFESELKPSLSDKYLTDDEKRIMNEYNKPINKRSTNDYKRSTSDHKKTVATHVCTVCKKHPVTKVCSVCKRSWYCNRACQKVDWKHHKQTCNNNSSIT